MRKYRSKNSAKINYARPVLWIISLSLAFVLSYKYIAPCFNQSILYAAAISMPEGVGETILSQLNQTMNPDAVVNSVVKPINSGGIPRFLENLFKPTGSSIDITPLTLEESEKGGAIIPQTFESKGNEPKYIKINDGNGYIKNTTNLSLEQIKKEISTQTDIKIDLSKNEPQVLIIHTHATESYDLYNQDRYKKGSNSRSTKSDINMIRVGDEIAKQLDEAKIPYIHSKTMHDSPSYNGAYDRSKNETEEYMKKYPSIKVVLDIHRDGIYGDNDSWTKPITEIDGKKAAQLMIITGCDDGTMENKEWQNNLRFAAFLQNGLERDYPTLTRPIMFCYRNYNQQLSHGALLIEIGSHGNFLGESVYTGELLGKSLAKSLKNLAN